jgi:hypothetical protein
MVRGCGFGEVMRGRGGKVRKQLPELWCGVVYESLF